VRYDGRGTGMSDRDVDDISLAGFEDKLTGRVHDLVGHRCFLGQVGVSQPDPTDESPMTTREAACSLQRY
jgi:hypothetical protein